MDSRYQQETFTPWSGDQPVTMNIIWNLDGISWTAAPAPSRRGHQHWAQTVGYINFNCVRRCPCGATNIRPHDDTWFHQNKLHERFADEPAPDPRRRRWMSRLF